MSDPPEDLAAFLAAELREMRRHLDLIGQAIDSYAAELARIRRERHQNVVPIRPEDIDRDLDPRAA